MFKVPQIHKNVHKTERDKRVYALRQTGLTLNEIAQDWKVIELSDGYLLSRERVRQIVEKVNKGQKSTN